MFIFLEIIQPYYRIRLNVFILNHDIFPQRSIYEKLKNKREKNRKREKNGNMIYHIAIPK